MGDQGVIAADGRIVRRSVADQVKLLEYGHADATLFGGSNVYSLLHMKAILLKGSGKAILGTYNNDPRSMLINSEGATILTGNVAQQIEVKIDEIIKNSHEYGSPEYDLIRSHPSLPASRRLVAEKMDLLHSIIMKLNLWWLI
jgi:phosphatidylserine/phosphatidylglycerophosphate/cardiolipin synthase-like enzyme